MTEWATFAGFTGVVLTVLLSLAHLSRDVPSDIVADESSVTSSRTNSTDASSSNTDASSMSTHTPVDFDGDAPPTSNVEVDFEFYPVGVDLRRLPDHRVTPHTAAEYARDDPSLSPYVLLANVIVGQALLGGLLAMGAWYSGVPLLALGLSMTNLPTEVGLGIALGVSLYAANRVGATVSRQLGFTPDETLRTVLTPDSTSGWVLLFLVALPLIAGFEELLFRGALVGATAVGFGLSPWLMAALSSVAFGIGHGAQGRLGIVVTGLFGFVLAAAFVLTESLVLVVVAHYLVNALEFVGHELFDWE